jgi:hypothetical protein
MATQALTLDGFGGAISIGGDEDDQDPTPDGEVLPDDEEQEDEERDPDPAGDDDAPRRN